MTSLSSGKPEAAPLFLLCKKDKASIRHRLTNTSMPMSRNDLQHVCMPKSKRKDSKKVTKFMLQYESKV